LEKSRSIYDLFGFASAGQVAGVRFLNAGRNGSDNADAERGNELVELVDQIEGFGLLSFFLINSDQKRALDEVGAFTNIKHGMIDCTP
jgi:hypothetical protein